jgi:hypothetical protein
MMKVELKKKVNVLIELKTTVSRVKQIDCQTDAI